MCASEYKTVWRVLWVNKSRRFGSIEKLFTQPFSSVNIKTNSETPTQPVCSTLNGVSSVGLCNTLNWFSWVCNTLNAVSSVCNTLNGVSSVTHWMGFLSMWLTELGLFGICSLTHWTGFIEFSVLDPLYTIGRVDHYVCVCVWTGFLQYVTLFLLKGECSVFFYNCLLLE